jgi:hypothetical protein
VPAALPAAPPALSSPERTTVMRRFVARSTREAPKTDEKRQTTTKYHIRQHSHTKSAHDIPVRAQPCVVARRRS